MKIIDLLPDQRRLSIEIDDLYDGWVESARISSKGRLRWKHRSGQDYLVLLRPGSDTGKSMGARSAETIAMFEEGRENEAREQEIWKRLLVKGRMFKAARLPVIQDFAAKALRELDCRDLLGDYVRVIGSTALVAYEIEANIRFPSDLLATEDFDLSWVGDRDPNSVPSSFVAALKSSDATWSVSQEKAFQLRNRAGDMIDVVIAPELVEAYPTHEQIRALPTEGQEYLLGGQPVSHVVVDSLGKPARVVAPDPRLFALHKLFLADQPKRGIKKSKDQAQALAMLEAIETHMPHYPMDQEFEEKLPSALVPYLHAWQKTERAHLKSKEKRPRI